MHTPGLPRALDLNQMHFERLLDDDEMLGNADRRHYPVGCIADRIDGFMRRGFRLRVGRVQRAAIANPSR